MNKNALQKILDHPDKEEIISKLIIGISSKDIHDWLAAKYSNVSDAKFIISEKSIKSFQDNYLDLYNHIKQDLLQTQNNINSGLNISQQADLAVRDNPTYKETMLQLANNELDIKKMIVNMVVNMENRIAQIYDMIQEDPRNLKMDRTLIEWFDKLGLALEKYHKIVLGGPDQIIQHNINNQQVLDQHISVFYSAIKKTLEQMDLETSLYFMEVFNQEISKLKMTNENSIAPTEIRLAEAKILNETINKKLNE